MKQIISITVILIICINLAEIIGPAGSLTVSAAKKPANRYILEVDTANQQVRAFRVADNGKRYLHKKFICSTGTAATPTPHGTFKMGPIRQSFGYFVKWKCWAQYKMQIVGAILFHSVLYREQDPDTLIYSSLYALGKPASHGCVRLRVSDARWIWNNCPPGTTVEIGAYKASAAKAEPHNLPSGIKLNKTEISIKKGSLYRLTAKIYPSKAADKLFWYSTNKRIITVNNKGVVKARKTGTAGIRVRTVNGKKSICKVKVKYPKVTGLKTNYAGLTMGIGDIKRINAAVIPRHANPKLRWQTDNSFIVSVTSKGKITAVGAGTAVIKITAKNGINKNITVTVTSSETEPPVITPTPVVTPAPIAA